MSQMTAPLVSPPMTAPRKTPLFSLDNRYIALGKSRPAATVHDLREALDAIVAGKPVAHPRTEAVGCYIPR